MAHDDDVEIRQFLRTVKHQVRATVALADTEQALDKWTITACQALYFERSDLVELAIEQLHEAYSALPLNGVAITEKRLAVAIRLYTLGSLAVRMDAWPVVRSVVLRTARIHPADGDYVHSSWIRDAHVEAARAGLVGREAQGGYLISSSRQLMADRPAMRPDLPDNLVPPPGSLTDDDPLLNSLCQFDILYCLLVATEGATKVRNFYPSSAAFNEARADPALVKVATNPAVRAALFPNSSSAQIASATHTVGRLALREAINFGGRWWGPPPSVQTFLTSNGADEI